MSWLGGNPAREVDDILVENFIRETRLVDQLDRHAERFVRYPAAHRDLKALAERTAEAARDLATAIARRGGRLPAIVPGLHQARADWERLSADREALRGEAERYLDDAHAVERDHPEVSALLLEIREWKVADYRAVVRLLAGFEPAVLDQPDKRPSAAGALAAVPGAVSTGDP